MNSTSDIRVLLVSSSAAALEEMRRALPRDTFHLEEVRGARDAIVALRRLPSEVTMVDVGTGDGAGMRELELISSTTADTVLIAVTGTADEGLVVRTLELGAQDCLVRDSDDLDPEHLARTIRKALARSAHDSSRPLATLIELSSDAIMTINRDRLITRFNGAAERMSGWRSSDVLGTPARILLADPETAPQIPFVDRIFNGESLEAFQLSQKMPDGRTLIMSMSGSPIVDAFGEVVEACLIIRDVTDEVNARLRLSEQQWLLESSQAAGRVGTWAADRLTGRIDWSAENFRLLKRDPALGPGTTEEMLALVHPDDRERVQSALRTETGFTVEARFIADPDDVRILRVRGEYIPREDGSPGRMLGITQDVTEERAEQAARQLAEEQLRRAFDEALIGMVILDMDNRPLRVNNALCEIFGRSRAELLATRFQDLTHPDDRGDDEGVMEALLSGSKHHVREKRYVHADGHTIWTEVAVSLITNPDGSPSHMVGQIQDITERRAHVEHLRHMADHDPLTGLLNRRGFDEELSAHVARSQRYGVRGALLIFDLDNFKLHNDTYGHNAGDELLVALAAGLRKRLRTTDVIGRLGGDEFAILLPDADNARTAGVAQALLEHIRGITATPIAAARSAVTASIGFVCLDAVEPLTPAEAIRCADQAMYAAKRSGRNGFAAWKPAPATVRPASD